MGNILTVALNAAIDTTLTIPSSFTLGESHRAGDVLKLPGGKGVNVARVLHTIEVPVHVIGLAGGSMGAFITEGLAQEGINSTFLPIAVMKRAHTLGVPTVLDTSGRSLRPG